MSLLNNYNIFNKIYQLLDVLEEKMLTSDDIKRREIIEKFNELDKKMEQLQADYYNLFLKYYTDNNTN